MSNEAELLLDTCALIFVSLDSEIRSEASEAIRLASENGRLRVSPISAWEIGMAMSKGRLKSPLPPTEFFRRFLKNLNAEVCALTPEILIDSSYLPANPHGDPTDRILMASARTLDMVLVTRDQPILDYGQAGHLRTLAC
jgi:PIN domain nuclease of toxin-antitoxin system